MFQRFKHEHLEQPIILSTTYKVVEARSPSLPKPLWEVEEYSIPIKEQGLNGTTKTEERVQA